MEFAMSNDHDMSEAQDKALRMVADSLHRLNYAVIKAVESGLSVELMRASRFHDEEGGWGDQLIPIIHRRDK
jgi:hypothetical protein